MDTSLYPTVRLSGVGVTRDLEPDMTLLEPENSTHPAEITGTAKSPFTPGTTPPVPAIVIANMTLYDRNFDDMDNFNKAQAISMLLDTLPSIKELRAYLVKQSRQSVPDLRTWQERISPAALGLLRWIIASNRSCIVQVDKCPGQEATDPSIRLEQKCSDVSDNWVQFRFAQGAPDKEQRFLNALRTEKQNLDPRYPTLFAFHGSPLGNWHSIIRQGLDFNDTLHGRAYGHGVYHALDQSTSLGYTSGLGTAVV
jgi:ubiquitin-conjugating enzyme E2 Q